MPDAHTHPSSTFTVACLNCGAALSGPYCSGCGQAAQSPLKPFGEFLREGISELVSLDGKQLRSLVALVRSPGLLTAEYLAGRRTRYVHPVRLFVWAGVLSYLLTSTVPADSLIFSLGPRLFGADTSLLDLAFLAWIIPAGALAHWAALRKDIPFFIGHLVVVLHLATFTFVFAPLEAAINWATAGVPMLSMVILVAPVVWLAYWLMSLARILEITPRRALVKAFWVYVYFMAALLPVILADLVLHG